MLAGFDAEGVAGEGDGGGVVGAGLGEGAEVGGDVCFGVEFEGARGQGEVGGTFHDHDLNERGVD